MRAGDAQAFANVTAADRLVIANRYALAGCAKRADRTGKSFARTVIHLLEERLGLLGSDGEDRLHHDLDHLAGRWSVDDGTEFDRALSEQRGIDPELWR